MQTVFRHPVRRDRRFERRLWGAMLCAFSGVGMAGAVVLHILPVA